MGLAKKILLGYAVIGLFLIGVVATTLWQVAESSALTNRIVGTRAPSAQGSLMALNGVNHSLASLRGWMILGKDKFKDERAIAWDEEIDASLASLQALSASWTNPANLERLASVITVIEEFRTRQDEIETIAHSSENTPATQLLLEEAAPRALILGASITELIDLELGLEATPERKALLGMMADVRGTLGLGLASIRAYLLSGDEAFKASFDKLWEKNTRRFGDLTANRELLTTEQQPAFERFSQVRREFDQLPPKMFEIRGSESWNLANFWLATRAAPLAGRIVESLAGMMHDQASLMEADMAASVAGAERIKLIEWGLLLAGILTSGVVGFSVMRSITRPVRRAADDLNEGSSQVASAADQVSSASQSLAEGASQQAGGLGETSGSLESISAMTKTNAEKANETDRCMKEAVDLIGKGKTSMDRLTGAIGEIKASAEETSRIVKTIDEIASQTNLLALNAAVEAARAGEAGRGFAVVAEEVRNLAERASEAARDTSGLIDASLKNADQGATLAEETSASLDAVITTAEEVRGLVSEISDATDKQAIGIEHISIAVREMGGITQQNAANAEETAAAAEELSSHSESLRAIVTGLNAVISGGMKRNRGSRKGGGSHHGQVSEATRVWSNSMEYDGGAGRSSDNVKGLVGGASGERKERATSGGAGAIIPLDADDLSGF